MQCRFTLLIEEELHNAVTAEAPFYDALGGATVEASDVPIITFLSSLRCTVSAEEAPTDCATNGPANAPEESTGNADGQGGHG